MANPILDYSDTVVYERERLPFSDTDGALTKAADAVVGAVGQAEVDNLQTSLTGATDAFISEVEAGQAALAGPLADDVIAKAIDSPVGSVTGASDAIKPVLQQLARLKLAEEQGSLSTSELRIRHEDILRRAVARMPAFASDLIQAAGETLGYNPIGSQLEALEAELRANDGGSSSKNDVEKYYDEQADKLGIDRTQKWSDPVGYYSKVHREISLNEIAQVNARTLAQKVTTRQINEEDAFDSFRTEVVPSLYNRFVGRLVEQAQVFAKQEASGLGASIESGALRAFQTEILRAKQGIQEAILASPMSNYLSQERIQQATKGVSDMLDEAAKATDPGSALTLVKQFLEAQTLNRVDLKYPDLGSMRALFSDIGKLPSGSLIAQRVEASVADATSLALLQAYGGVINGNPAYPQQVVPPLPGLKIPERLKAEKEAANLLNELAATETRDLASVRATLRGLGTYAQQYLNNKKGTGQAPPRAEARQWLNSMASDTWFKNVSQPGVSQFEVTSALVPYAEMVSDEAVDIGYDIQEALHSADVRYTTKMKNPSGRRGLERNRKIPGSATVGDFVTLVWENDKVVVKPLAEVNPDIKISGDSLNKAVAKLQNQVSANATLVVKASAHMNAAIRGTKVDYDATLNAPLTENGRSLNEIMLTVPMEDIAGGN
jgi:hypothetical protein